VNITFIIPQDGLSGGIRVVSIYAEQLQKRGHDITVIAAPPPRSTLKQQIKALLRLRPKKAAVFKAQDSYFKDLKIQFQTLDQYRPLTNHDVPDADVVIATWWETAEWMAPLASQKGVKVHFIQGYEVFDYLSTERVETAYRLPYAKITISQWLFDLMQNRYESKHTFLVPNGVNLAQFHSPQRVQIHPPTVGLVYATTPCKGCDISLEAFAQARTQIPNLQLVAFGMEQPTAALPLPEGTQYDFQPPQHRLRELYAQCNAWLVGSREEGFGLPTLEAMACRTPVIATPSGAAPELLSQGGGILLKDCEATSMAQAIQNVCTLGVAQWQQLSDNAYQTACQRGWEDAADQFEAALYAAITLETPHS
jgi:glycosyltransferase involved in cell wall biosynthesis